MGTRLDLSGEKFGKLTAIAPAGYAKNGKTLWLCRCDCGKLATVKTNELRTGGTKSCGCLVKEVLSVMHRTHGMSGDRIYRIWRLMKNRCTNSRSPDYPHYGGRGITVCDEWRNSFEAFRDWALANGYADNLSIDRIDVNGNYCPENCRWATQVQQCENRTNNNLITCDGETLPVKVWAKRLSISADVLYSRKRHGWSDEMTIKTPVIRK